MASYVQAEILIFFIHYYNSSEFRAMQEYFCKFLIDWFYFRDLFFIISSSFIGTFVDNIEQFET